MRALLGRERLPEAGSSEDAAFNERLWFGWSFAATVAVVIVIGVVLRLPQLFGVHAMLDGDEAVLGIMARRLRTGQEFPLFFHGQAYGLSLLEAAAVAASSFLLGDGLLAVRTGAGLIWFCGVVVWASAAKRAAGARAGVVMAALLVTAPAWMAWSMKARGGYVTAFLLLGFLFRSLAERRSADPTGSISATLRRGVKRGCLLGLVALAQPVFALVALPVLALRIGEEIRGVRPRRDGGASSIEHERVHADGHAHRLTHSQAYRLTNAIAAFASPLLFALAASGGLLLLGSALRGAQEGEWSPNLFGPFRPLEMLARLPELLSVASGGQYFYMLPGTPDLSVRIIGWIWAGLTALIALWASIRGRGPWTQGVGLGVWLACLGLICLNPAQVGYRYMLVVPLCTIWLLAMGGRLAQTVAGVLAVVGAGLAPSFAPVSLAVPPGADVTEGEKTALRALLLRLEEEQIEHVFVLDPMLQWNLIHDTEERVAARWLRPADRYPEFTDRVDQALRSGAKVALLGPGREATPLNHALDRARRTGPRAELIGTRYFVLVEPDETLLREIGFRFRTEASR